jgi:anti-sigma28 factor (negative regulator of flagellin synthesis)
MMMANISPDDPLSNPEKKDNTIKSATIQRQSDQPVRQANPDILAARTEPADRKEGIMISGRAARLTALKQQIEAGEYHPDLDKVAESLLRYIKHR